MPATSTKSLSEFFLRSFMRCAVCGSMTMRRSCTSCLSGRGTRPLRITKVLGIFLPSASGCSIGAGFLCVLFFFY